MVRILLSGCSGAMGKVIAGRVAARDDCVIAAGLDVVKTDGDFPVYTSADEIDTECDVIIDFSHPNALEGVLKYALATSTPAVIATTGFNEEQKASISLAATQIPVFFSANMSVGINLMCELAKKAAEILGSDFDVEIVEAHHNKKIDAPSGTAIMLADAVASGLDFEPQYEYNRHAKHEKRQRNEIGLHSIRGGTIVGEHEIIFAGDDEIVKISHTAMSKKILANGGINAAMFLVNKQPALYSMKDMVGNG